MGSKLINHLCYADDTVLLSPSLKSLQKLVEICESFGSKFDILFNTSKTKIMVFQPKQWYVNQVNVLLYNQVIENVTEFCYLGVEINNYLNDNNEIKHQYRNLCARSNTLIRKFHDCSPDIKIFLFKTFCTSVYGLGLWCQFTKKVFNTFKVCYNNAFRMLMDFYKYCTASNMLVSNNVSSVGELLRSRQFMILNNISISQNKLVKQIYQRQNQSPLTEFWNKTLYL